VNFSKTLASLAVASASLCGAAGYAVGQDNCPEVIKLGTTVSDSGAFSPLSAGWHEMIVAYAQKINDAGGVALSDCGSNASVELVVYDDQSNPATAVTLFEKMISEEGVDFLVGPDWSSLGLAVSSVAERHDIPVVMANVAAPNVYREGQTNVFGTPYPIVPLWSKRYFEMLETVEPKPTSIFFVVQDNPITNAISGFWTKQAEESSYSVVGTETFPSDLKDFTSIILKIRQAKPDIIYISSFDTASVPLVQQMRQLRVKAMDVHHVMLSGALANQVGEDVEGLSGEIGWINSIDNEESALAAEVMAEVGLDPFLSVFAIARYTPAVVMLQAIEMAGSVDRDKVRQMLRSATFEGPGGEIRFDHLGYPSETNGAFTIQIQDGNPEVVWPPELQTKPVAWPAPSWQ